MNQDIGSVIKMHRKRLGLTLQEMQNRTGINNGNLSKIERGQQSLTNETMKAIAQAFGMNLSDLFSAQKAQGVESFGQNSATTKAVPQLHRFVSDFDAIEQIPEDEFVIVGNMTAAIDPVRGGIKIDIDRRHGHLFKGDVFQGLEFSDTSSIGVYVVQDDMMESRLFKGDTVLVDIASTTVPATGGVFCVVLDGETIEFRRLMPYPGHGLRVMCDNPKYPEAVLDHRQASMIQVVGRVKLVRSTAGL
jgi:phage repressor protein C with HTH and peptisase S24 domain